MAPDRTSSSFLQAQAQGIALSSHGLGHAPSLERGKACLTCRQRKVKCDGVKPVCGACARSAHAHGEDASLLNCNFEEPRADGEKRKRGPNGAKVVALEAKVAELERLLAMQSRAPPATETDYSPSTSSYPIDPSLLSNVNGSDSPTNFEALLQASTSPFQGGNFNLSSTSSPHGAFDLGGLQPLSTFPDSPPETDPLLQLFYPGWDSSLPSPTMLTKLVDVYFSRPHVASGMVNKVKLLTALTLPPTHAGFPSTCLLHAMCATAARIVECNFFAGEDAYWTRLGPVENPADYHSARAKQGIEDSIKTGQRFLQTTQAIVLVCLDSYIAARFVEVWLFTGMCTRVVVPLGITHVRSISPGDPSSAFHKPDMIPTTDDDEELIERAATCWMAAAFDTFASASTGWSHSLDEQDITTLLPPASGAYPIEDLTASPLSVQNPSFLQAHPPHLVEETQLFFKATVLLRRVVCHMQRAPSPFGKSPPIGGSFHGLIDIRATPAHRKLDAEAETFRMSIPREYRTPEAHARDPRLFLIHAIAHTATILLHESSSTAEPGCASLAKCLGSAHAIVQSIYDLTKHMKVGMVIPPFVNYCWVVAGRTLVRELALATMHGKFQEAAVAKEDVHAIIMAQTALNNACASTSSKALQSLLADPQRCLPPLMTPSGPVGAANLGPSTGIDACGGPDELFRTGMVNSHQSGFTAPSVDCYGDITRPGEAVGALLPHSQTHPTPDSTGSAAQGIGFSPIESPNRFMDLSGFDGGQSWPPTGQ